jgi:hypothetical protein
MKAAGVARERPGNVHVYVNDHELLTVPVPAQPQAAGVEAAPLEEVEMRPVEATPPPEIDLEDLPEGFVPPTAPVETVASVAETTPPTEPPVQSAPDPDTSSEPFELLTGAWT